MSRVDNYINMLKEFYYKKNGKVESSTVNRKPKSIDEVKW